MQHTRIHKPSAPSHHSSRPFFTKGSRSQESEPFFTQPRSTPAAMVQPQRETDDQEELEELKAKPLDPDLDSLQLATDDSPLPPADHPPPAANGRLNVQTKLTVGQPNDRYEQEADQVADQVMRMTEPTVQRQPEEDAENDSPDLAQRKCDTCKQQEKTIQPKLQVGQLHDQYEQEADRVANQVVSYSQAFPDSLIQAKAGLNHPHITPFMARQGNGLAKIEPHVEQSIQQTNGSGRALSQPAKTAMEQLFGADFSDVKVHTDDKADQLNRSLNARAFTTGQNIYFKQGEYQPNSQTGQKLLAHELTHVVQQRGNSPVLIQRDSVEELVNRQERELSALRHQLSGEVTTGATAEEREEASVRLSLLQAARTFGEMDGQARVFSEPLYRFGRGTPSSRIQWQGVLRQLVQADFVERACFVMNSSPPRALPRSVTCHPMWDDVINYQGRPIHVYPGWRSLVYDHPEVAALRDLGGDYVNAYWVGRYRGTQGMTSWDIWDTIDMLEPVFAGLGSIRMGAGRAAVQRALGLAGNSVRGLYQALRSTRPFSRLVARLNQLVPVTTFVRGARIALHSLNTARQWISRQMSLTVDIVENLSLAAIERLASLGHAAVQRIAALSNAAKRILLGCLSPCAVDIATIRQFLASPVRTGSRTVLRTIDDVLAALPSGLNRVAVRSHLRRHPGLMSFITEARIDSSDFQVLSAFVTAADTGARSARQTFSRFISQLVPAKVGANITEFNRIVAAAVAREPRIASALKGPMFEAWVWQFVHELRNRPFARLTFTSGRRLRLTQTRTFDGFVASLERVYEMKHTFARVPRSQLDDYLTILRQELRRPSPRFREIVYVFPSRTAAELNRHLLSYAASGIVVKYVSPVGRLLSL